MVQKVGNFERAAFEISQRSWPDGSRHTKKAQKITISTIAFECENFSQRKLTKERKLIILALIKCPDCRREVSDLAEFCINCGRPMLPKSRQKADIVSIFSDNPNDLREEQEPTRAANGSFFVVIVGLLIVFAFLVVSVRGSQPKAGKKPTSGTTNASKPDYNMAPPPSPVSPLQPEISKPLSAEETALKEAIELTKSHPNSSLFMKITGYKYALEELDKLKKNYPSFKADVIASLTNEFVATKSTLESKLQQQDADALRGLNYSVLKDSATGSIKRSLDIRLEKKIDKETLTNLAIHLEKSSTKFSQTFICYFLPGQKPGSGAWATTHFTPKLVVKILGPSLEFEKKAKEEPLQKSDIVIGKWFDNSPFIGGVISFVKRSSKTIMIRKFKDGSGKDFEMLQTKKSGKDCFTRKDGNVNGEYYLIEKNGALGIYDSDGLLKTISKAD